MLKKIGLLGLLFCVSFALFAGDLNDFENDFDRKKPPPADNGGGSSPAPGPEESDDSDSDSDSGSVLGAILNAIFSGGKSDDEEDEEDDHYIPPAEPSEREHPEFKRSIDGPGSLLLLLGHPILGGMESINMVSAKSRNQTFLNLDYLLEIEKRSPGDVSLPYLRTDIQYQFINKDLFALDLMVEAGYGVMGARYDHIHFYEFNPEDEMSFDRLVALYRMSFLGRFEMSYGVGGVVINGNRQSNRFVIAIPMRLFLGKYFTLEVLPEWYLMTDYVTITHLDFNLVVNTDWFGAKLGYTLFIGYEETLHGPTFGLSLRL